MKEGKDIDDQKTGNDNGAYVHCSEKTNEDKLDVARTKEIIKNSHSIHREIQGSSDFICKYLLCFTSIYFILLRYFLFTNYIHM